MTTSGDLSDIYKPQAPNLKRRRFLQGVPAEHQDLYRSGDRFTIQNASCLVGKGNKIYDKITFRPQKPTEILIFSYEGNVPIDDYSRSCIHAYALSILYSTEWQDETNPSYAETLGSIITILATYTPYSNLKESGLETFLARCHITVQKTTWTTLEEVNLQTKEVRDDVAIHMGLDSFDATPQACTIVALSTLILIGKNVTEVNRDGWFKNRWRALAHVASVSIDADRMEPPLLRPCQAIYSSSSSNQPIRSCLFKVMRTMSCIVEDQNHVIFDRIIRLLQWAEMSHIWMIMDYIYGQNPDILNFPELHGPEIATMMVAIEFLKKYPKEERAYLKLLYDHNDLMPLHSANFIYFTAAAHAIAALTKTSMLNINSRFSEGVKAFQGRVIDYINARNKIGALSAAVGYSSTLPGIVQKSLLKAIGEATTEEEVPDFIDRQPEVRFLGGRLTAQLREGNTQSPAVIEEAEEESSCSEDTETDSSVPADSSESDCDSTSSEDPPLEMDSRDRNPITAYDVTPETGACQDLSDESLNAALATSSKAQQGTRIEKSQLTKENLEERLKMMQLTQVEGDSSSLPVDEGMSNEDVVFKDIDTDDYDDLEGNNPNEDDEPSMISQVDPTIAPITDPNQWIINALKTIHTDIQQMKPVIDQIPVIKTRVDEIQGVLGVVTSGFIEMKNSIRNMEATITQNRIEIAKLTDLIKSTPQPIQPKPGPSYKPAQVSEKSVEENVDKLIQALSKYRNLSPDHEVMIRNMLMIHDKDIVQGTLAEIGTSRPPLGAEIDRLIGVNIASSASMLEAYNLLMSLIPVKQGEVSTCSGPCTPPLPLSAPQTPKSVPNPFKAKK